MRQRRRISTTTNSRSRTSRSILHTVWRVTAWRKPGTVKLADERLLRRRRSVKSEARKHTIDWELRLWWWWWGVEKVVEMEQLVMWWWLKWWCCDIYLKWWYALMCCAVGCENVSKQWKVRKGKSWMTYLIEGTDRSETQGQSDAFMRRMGYRAGQVWRKSVRSQARVRRWMNLLGERPCCWWSSRWFDVMKMSRRRRMMIEQSHDCCGRLWLWWLCGGWEKSEQRRGIAGLYIMPKGVRALR